MELTQLRYTLREAAKLLRLSVQSLKRRIKDGRLRAVKDGKSYFVLPDELDRYARGASMPRQIRRAG